MQKELIKLANHLDRLGRKTEADYLDVLVGAISKAAQDEDPLDIKGFDQDVEMVASWIGSLHNSGHLNVDSTIGETIRNISMEIVRALASNQQERAKPSDQQFKDVGYGYDLNSEIAEDEG